MIQVKVTLPPEDSNEIVYEACGTSAVSVAARSRKEAFRKSLFCRDSSAYLVVSELEECSVKSQGKMEGKEEAESYYYFASLFAKCDPQETGLVKVSVLLSTLRELQAMAEDSSLGTDEDDGDGGASSSLVELKQELDWKDEDPEITLGRFIDGITSYLQKNGNDDHGQLEENKSNESKVVEAIVVESVDKQEADKLRRQNSDLRLQLQKVTDDNLLLKNHVSTAQDENCSVIQALDKKSSELKAQAERIKRLEREMDDKSEIICGLEGRNAALCKKCAQLGNELSVIHKERKKLVSEAAQLKEEVKKSLELLKSKDNLLSKITNETKTAETQWQNREKCLNDRIKTLNDSIDELNQTIEELEIGYSKLKQAKNEKGVQQTAKTYAEEFTVIDNSSQHFNDFYCPFISDDIATELVQAGETQQVVLSRSPVERFDVSTQCDTETIPQGFPILQTLPCCATWCKPTHQINDTCGGHELVPRFSDQHLVAEYIPQDGINEDCNWSWKEFSNWTSELIKRKSIWCLVVAIIVGLIVFTPMDDGCITNPFIFRGIENYFKFCGRFSHDHVPII